MFYQRKIIFQAHFCNVFSKFIVISITITDMSEMVY